MSISQTIGIRPWGIIFIKALKLVAAPLVFFSLIKGISSMSDIAKLSAIGGKIILIYFATTVVAIFIGLLVVNILKLGNAFLPNIDFTSAYN